MRCLEWMGSLWSTIRCVVLPDQMRKGRSFFWSKYIDNWARWPGRNQMINIIHETWTLVPWKDGVPRKGVRGKEGGLSGGRNICDCQMLRGNQEGIGRQVWMNSAYGLRRSQNQQTKGERRERRCTVYTMKPVWRLIHGRQKEGEYKTMIALTYKLERLAHITYQSRAQYRCNHSGWATDGWGFNMVERKSLRGMTEWHRLEISEWMCALLSAFM